MKIGSRETANWESVKKKVQNFTNNCGKWCWKQGALFEAINFTFDGRVSAFVAAHGVEWVETGDVFTEWA